jgi:hypothetical protein
MILHPILRRTTAGQANVLPPPPRVCPFSATVMDASPRFRWLALLLFLLPVLPVHAQHWQWAQHAGGVDWDAGTSVAVDASGHLYVTGYFTDTATFGGFTLQSISGRAIFVARYSPEGAVQWARQAGGVFYDEGLAIAVDADGNAYVTGYFIEGATFGTLTLPGSGHADVFVAKYAPDGDLLWARQAGGSRWDHGAAIAVDASGHVYVTGTFTASATFGAFSLESTGLGDVFIARYSPAGELLWVRQAGGPDPDVGMGIAVDAEGNVYVTGEFGSTAQFGPFTLVSAGGSDVFVAKYSPEGEVLWARRAGGWASAMGRDVAVDAAGHVYITGEFIDQADFDAHVLVGAGYKDVFLAKYSSEGEVLWARNAGGTFEDVGNALALDGAGNVYVAGYFQGAAAFGALTLTSAVAGDVFVAKYSSGGEVLWVQQAGGLADNAGLGIAANAAGNVYVTGRMSGTAGFGAISLTSAGVWDVFVASLVDADVSSEGGPASPQAALVLSPVWPNPATTRATVTLTPRMTHQHAIAEVFDVLGRRVGVAFEGALAPDVPRIVEVDTSLLPPGPYVLRVTAGEGTMSRRFLVLR